MKKELSSAKEIVQKKTIENNRLLKIITEKFTEANNQKKNAKEAEEQLSVEYEKITIEKEEAEVELKKAEPRLIEAEEGLGNIKKEAIQEIKSFAKPVQAVSDVGACIVILLSRDDKSTAEPTWAQARAMMCEAGFLTELKSYDKKRITASKMQRVNAIFKRQGESFSKENIEKVSSPPPVSWYGWTLFVSTTRSSKW